MLSVGPNTPLARVLQADSTYAKHAFPGRGKTRTNQSYTHVADTGQAMHKEKRKTVKDWPFKLGQHVVGRANGPENTTVRVMSRQGVPGPHRKYLPSSTVLGKSVGPVLRLLTALCNAADDGDKQPCLTEESRQELQQYIATSITGWQPGSNDHAGVVTSIQAITLPHHAPLFEKHPCPWQDKTTIYFHTTDP